MVGFLEEFVKSFEVVMEGKKTEVTFLRTQDQLWVHYQGVTRVLELKRRGQARKKAESAHEAGEIVAPMPGKITHLRRGMGEWVVPGDVLVVMEAMKMEYVLKSPLAGQVVEVKCQAGQQVQEDQLLVRLKPGVSKS